MSKIAVKIPTDFKDYEAKWFLGLTKRQLICFGIAVVVGLPTYFGFKYYVDEDIAKYALIFICAPCFIFLKKFNGYPLEVFLKLWIRRNFTPLSRPYRIENHYDILSKVDDNIGKLQKKAATTSKKAKRRAKAKSKKPKKGTKNLSTNPTV